MSEEAQQPESRGYLAASKVEIKYTFARFHRRVFANLIDFLLCMLVFVGLFVGLRAIVINTPGYVQNETSLLDTRVASGLYVRQSNGKVVDVVTYVGIAEYNFDAYNKMKRCEDAITKFIQYTKTEAGEEASFKVQGDFNEYIVKGSWNYEGIPYFVQKDGNWTRNRDCPAPYIDYYNKIYGPYIDEHAQGFLITLIPHYLDCVRYETVMLIAAELVPAYLTAPFLTYLLPMLLFRRGRMTLGKFAYHIGVINKDLLVPSWKRTLARFFIFYGAEMVLAPFTFAIPFIVSVSLMAFSKGHQGLPDYFLSLYEVDTTNSKLYFSREEIVFEGGPSTKEPVKFQPTYED